VGSCDFIGTRGMPPESQQCPLRAGPLAGRLGADAGVEQVANATLAVWQEIDATLVPVLGQRGVAALFNRSLNLVSSTHPWLAVGLGGALEAVDPAALRSALLGRTPADALADATALYRTFHELLAGLIGVPLTNRLLRSVWEPSTGATAAQDRLT
jgi:hypothetical protein